MGASPNHIRKEFLDDLRAAATTARRAVIPKCATTINTVWDASWLPFTASLGLDPLLSTIKNKVPFLSVFGTRIRDGRASRSGNPVTAATVADEILFVAKTFTELGAPDPRLTSYGKLDPRLSAFYKGMKNSDPAPVRVQPLALQVLHTAHHLALATGTAESIATVDMAWLGFYFLLRTNEFCASSNSPALCVRHITLCIGQSPIEPLRCPLDNLARVTTSAITFDTHKNRVWAK